MASENDIIRGVECEYLDSIKDVKKMPSPEEMERQLLEMLKERLELENALRVRGDKLPMPQKLPNCMIAALICNLYPVIEIDMSGSGQGELAIYEEEGADQGLYTIKPKTLNRLIKRFNYSAKPRDIEEVRQDLMDRVEVRELTNDPDLIAVNNGIFDFKKKELMPFSPEWVFIAKTGVNYRPCVQNPVICHPNRDLWDVETWMEEISDGDPEICALLWMLLGAIIRHNVPWHKMVLLYDERGNNGKGTLCELMRNICGQNRCASLTIDGFSEPFGLEPLIGSIAVIGDENPTRCFTQDISNLKAVITGDPVNVNRKNKSMIKLRFQGLVVQCLNDLPKTRDRSESLYRRFLTVPFKKCFTGTEKKYIKKEYIGRTDVLEYVLHKVLNMDFYELPEPDVCKGLIEEVKVSNDVIRQFLDEMLLQVKWDLLPWSFLHDLYVNWCKRTNPSGKPESKLTFMKDVRSLIHNYNGWECTGDTAGDSKKLIRVPEPLIIEYGLKEWMASYRGCDPDKICLPDNLHKNYRGLVRV